MDWDNPITVLGVFGIPALFLVFFLTRLESTIDPLPSLLTPEEHSKVDRLKQCTDLTKDKANQNTLKTSL